MVLICCVTPPGLDTQSTSMRFLNFLNIIIHLAHGIASLLTSLFELHFQYFKMDSGTFDDYGGVEHAEYCFQV